MLASLAGLSCLAVGAGCGGGSRELTPGEVEGSPPPVTTQGGTGSGTPTGPGTGTPSSTGTPASTETRTEAPVPPNGSLELVDAGVSVSRDGGYVDADAYVTLENRGGPTPVTYEVLELRFDLLFTPIGGDQRRVASSYGTRTFFDESDGGFAPGETRRVDGVLRFARGGSTSRSTDDRRYDVEFAYRRVSFR